MKNIDATAKFAFKKTTVTVFNKAAASAVQHADDTSVASTIYCQWTSIWTSSVADTQRG
ncbi:hypothetical protein [Hymenobacter lucidus]|uniref:Uncharacterized protein n=1 Tax=Hymenobacter lucidus TaxID=2880930 RepID=A0ABS8AVR0_9BACT|nr:hypothetical protein [Hymenobacter lucidus]MCB2409833.1 hypothetical protein [Hymenobacter lucidus]